MESKLHECEDMKYWGINEVKLYLKSNKDDKEEREDFELINNVENIEKNKKSNNNANNFKDSSEYLDDSEEDIKKYKNNIKNNEIYENKASAVSTERKKEDSFINNRIKKKKKVNIVINEDSDDEKNIINKKEDKFFKMKSLNSNFPSIGFNKMPTQEDVNFKNGKDKDVIKNIISNFDDENLNPEFLSPNKRISSIQYPLIKNNLRSVSVNMDKNNEDVNDTKYVQNDFKNFKQEKRYGKKLVNIMRRRNDNKKD